MNLGSHPVWHPVFESLGYAAGYAVYKGARARGGDALDDEKRWSVVPGRWLGDWWGAGCWGCWSRCHGWVGRGRMC